MTGNKKAGGRSSTILQVGILAILLLCVAGLAARLLLPQQTRSNDAPLLVEGAVDGANAKPGTAMTGAVVFPTPAASLPAASGVPSSPGVSPDGKPPATQKPSAPPTPSPKPSPKPTTEPTPKATPAITPTPAPTKSPSKLASKPLSGKIIGIDPGHQSHANREQEPVAPGSSKTKDKVSSGTYGRFTGVREYEVALKVGLQLRDMLENLGAEVVMTRTKNDVDISNAERAKIFNKAKVDLGVRLHCNGSDNPDVDGAFMLVPKQKDYPYYEECVRAAKKILSAYGEATGISTKKGITYRDDQTGFNWCERPAVNIEMGHMTNKEEDEKLVDSAFQKKMAEGIKNGILAYFE